MGYIDSVNGQNDIYSMVNYRKKQGNYIFHDKMLGIDDFSINHDRWSTLQIGGAAGSLPNWLETFQMNLYSPFQIELILIVFTSLNASIVIRKVEGRALNWRQKEWKNNFVHGPSGSVIPVHQGYQFKALLSRLTTVPRRPCEGWTVSRFPRWSPSYIVLATCCLICWVYNFKFHVCECLIFLFVVVV